MFSANRANALFVENVLWILSTAQVTRLKLNIPRHPPIWACVCGCKRFRKINPDGTDASHITDAEFRRRRRGWNQAFMTER